MIAIQFKSHYVPDSLKSILLHHKVRIVGHYVTANDCGKIKEDLGIDIDESRCTNIGRICKDKNLIENAQITLRLLAQKVLGFDVPKGLLCPLLVMDNVLTVCPRTQRVGLG